MRPLHVPTVGIVVAAMVTGSLLTAVGVTLTDDPTPDVATSTESARDLWAECVTANLTGDGRGGDADMARCDTLYTEATGDTTTLWLWCPGAPEAGGCRAETGDGWKAEPDDTEPEVSHGGNTEPEPEAEPVAPEAEPSTPPVSDDSGPCAIYGVDTPERSACDDAKEDAADDGGEVGADEWCNADDPGYPCDPATMPALPTEQDTDA